MALVGSVLVGSAERASGGCRPEDDLAEDGEDEAVRGEPWRGDDGESAPSLITSLAPARGRDAEDEVGRAVTTPSDLAQGHVNPSGVSQPGDVRAVSAQAGFGVSLPLPVAVSVEESNSEVVFPLEELLRMVRWAGEGL